MGGRLKMRFEQGLRVTFHVSGLYVGPGVR
ncbi:MAG: hypothetical protein KatS3mg110_2941 [Pirellulaceae bacterium]|nr:MAG: hypothetical protein KatS3mg110_2941 [Pirellulaceae bacterium]